MHIFNPYCFKENLIHNSTLKNKIYISKIREITDNIALFSVCFLQRGEFLSLFVCPFTFLNFVHNTKISSYNSADLTIVQHLAIWLIWKGPHYLGVSTQLIPTLPGALCRIISQVSIMVPSLVIAQLVQILPQLFLCNLANTAGRKPKHIFH